nr:MAG TPA: hypothetical protein [Caudoviricetes sp.]
MREATRIPPACCEFFIGLIDLRVSPKSESAHLQKPCPLPPNSIRTLDPSY